ncbi:MAG: TonB-dependent receptor [Pseudomonadota bacterium]
MKTSTSSYYLRKVAASLLACFSLAAVLASAPAVAQETTGSVRGVITGPNGEPVSGATVTVTSLSTGLTRTVSTDANGLYFVRQLPAGVSYNVIVTSDKGNAVTESLPLTVGQQAQLNYALNPIEELVVLGTITEVAETAIGPTAVFDLEALQNSPAINRNINDIIGQDPRVYIDQSSNADSIQCNGANPRFNSLTVDGIRLNDGFGLNSNGYPTQRMPFPFDAVSGVAVELAPMSVIYGGFSACNINAVTKSGGNELSGSVFVDFTSDSFIGDSIEGNTSQISDFDETRYGFELGGALIKDKLFFYGAYERYDGVDFNDRGAIGSGAINEVAVSQADLDEIAQISRDIYGFDPGTSSPSNFEFEDEKYIAKLDWYASDTQRVAFTYMFNDSTNTTPSDGEGNEFEFSEHFYNRGAELNSAILSLYSDWTPNFSTELRISRTDVDFVQEPRAGDLFGEFRIELADVDVYLGGDDSRHANALNYTIDQLVARGRYQADDHTITFGYEREAYDIFNLFYQHVDTEVRFSASDATLNDDNATPAQINAEAIDNFRQGLANRVFYGNAISNNQADIAEAFEYAINFLYVQDEWQVNDRLSLTYGLRYDYYETSDAPNENPEFTASYGFANNATLDGRDLLQPRFGITFDATDTLSLRGGIGLFSGGNPNVWLSNTYSNTNTTAVQTDADNVALFSQTYDSSASCEAGVPVRGPGYCVPDDLVATVASGDGSNFEIVYLDPDFDIPSEWKFTAGLTWLAPRDWTVSADVQITRGQDTAIYKRGDLEQQRDAQGNLLFNQGVYPVYDDVRVRSFVLTNARNGNESESISVGAFKSWDNGLDLRLGYAWTQAEDVNPMTSSVAFSNYVNRSFIDPQAEELAPSNWAIEHRFTAVLNYTNYFFGDYATRASLFGQYNSGIPFSITQSGFEGTVLAYGFQPFLGFNQNVLPPGGSRNSEEGPSFSKVDLRISQDVPGFSPDHRGQVFFVIDNLTNLLNDDWGVLEQPAFPYGVTQNQIDNNDQFLINGQTSLWTMRLGLRYEF